MNFLKKIKSSGVKYVVEYASLQEETIYALTKAKIVSGELSIDHQIAGNTIEELTSTIGHKPLTLIVNTNKVLTRKVAINTKTTQILSDAFPNLVLEDFYYQIYTTSQHAFVSVVRKEYVHSIIQEFKKNKITITNFIIGPIHISGVLKFLEVNEIDLLGYKIIVAQQSNEVTKIQPFSETTNKVYEIENQEIKSSNLLGVSVLIKQLLGTVFEGNIQDKNKKLKKEYAENQFFKNALIYGVGALLSLLLINAFVFNRKFSEIQLLQEEAQVFNSHKKRLKEKKETIKSKEAIVQSILNTGFSKSSFFANQIIQIIPKSILLEQFSYQPLLRSIKKNKRIEIEENGLEIKGISNHKEEFNTWLKQLENFVFVTNVIIEEYGVVKGKEASFEIRLNLKEDESKK